MQKSDQLKVQEAAGEYQRLAHAMQTGVAYLDPERFGGPPGTPSNELKHLRVGINSAMVDVSALAQLLIRKGLITELEYVEAVRDAMRKEVERYQADLEAKLGRPIRLG